MRFLIAGLGSIGRRHLRNLLSLGQKDIVLLRTGQSTLPDDDLAGFPVEKEIHAALLRWTPDAVIVANPTAMHLDVAIPAARAGCHLMIEKPISHSLQRVEELQAAVAARGKQVLVGFQFRFHPSLRKAKDLLDEGVVGGPISVRAHWGEYLPEWHPWEDFTRSYAAREDLGGGVALTLCHPFDYLRWLFGEPERVVAVLGSAGGLGLEVEDVVEAVFRFDGSVIASVHLDYNQRPPAHTLEIVCEEGMIRWDYHQREVSVWTTADKSWRSYPDPEGFDRNVMFLDEMRHFLDLSSGAGISRCTLEDGIRALRMALAAKRSAAEGKAVVLNLEYSE